MIKLILNNIYLIEINIYLLILFYVYKLYIFIN